MNAKIILNAIMTPDGTVLVSKHVHDYRNHTDANGETYAVDGGSEYLKRSGPNTYAELSIVMEDDKLRAVDRKRLLKAIGE